MMRYIIILLLCVGSALCADDDIILVVSKESPLDSVSETELKKLYIGKQTTLENEFTNPTILKTEGSHRKFLEKYLNLNARQFARIWQKLVFTGKAQMPKQYLSQEELIAILSENPDKVGYIERRHITSDLKEIEVTK